MKIKKSGPDDVQKAADAGTVAVTGFASMVHPLLGVAVGMAVALFGPAIERRQGRAKELIQYVHDNISEFTPAILSDEAFQDGFVLLMEKYIRERNDDKRVILQKVLRGYIQAPNLLDYPLEEMADLVSRIRMSDVGVLRKALQEEVVRGIFSPDSDPIMFNPNGSFLLSEDPNAVSRLIYFGLLHEDRVKNGPRLKEYDEKNFLHVWISPTGRAFAEYINQ